MASPHQNKPASELSQTEREAIVDLLHLCLYADAHISLRESKFISDTVEMIGWDTKLSFSAYEARSIAAARAARPDADSRKAFIQDANMRLPSKSAKEQAVRLCAELFASDGTEQREAELLGQIRSLVR